MADFDIIVIGSGVSGMTFAAEASEKGKKVLVLEKEKRAGGCLCTMYHEDFWLEMGGHTIYSSYATYINDMKQANIVSRFLPRVKQPFKMLVHGSLMPITSVLNKLELAINGVKLFFIKKDGRTVRQYYSAFLGKGNYEKMFRPMIAAVISQEGSDFPADMMLKKRPKDKSMPRSFTIYGGMNQYIQKTAERPNVTLKTSCGAESVSRADGIYSVVTETGETFTAKSLVMSCQPAAAGGLLTDVAPELSSVLNTIPSAKVESVGVILRKEDVRPEPFSFIIAQDSDFTSVVSRDVVRDEKYRGLAFHFKPDRLDNDRKMAIIEEITGVSRHAFAAEQEVVHMCPTLSLGHEKKVEQIDTLLASQPNLYITGNYFGGLAIEDCAIRSRSEAARLS